MDREIWKTKYREWRVQDRTWRELQRTGKYKMGGPVPAFVTWSSALYSPTRLFGDTLGVFTYHTRKLAANTNTVRMRHLRYRVRLPA